MEIFSAILLPVEMTTSAPARRLVFPAKQQVFIESYDAGSPAEGEVRVRTTISLMSTGTENIVFNRLFEPDTHWDQWVKYPFYPGYTSVGVVEELGAGVASLKVGDRVAFRVGHRSHHVLKAADCHPIPNNLPDEQAIWFSLAKITYIGAKVAEYHLGDSALVIGAGPIGQMSIRWARAAGLASIIVVDTAVNRMPLAQAGGATDVIPVSITEAHDAVLNAGGGKLPRVIIDSTGNAAVFSAALGLAADFGRVVVLGDTGAPGLQALTSDVIRRGLVIVGAHDMHGNDAEIVPLFFKLATTGRFPMEGLTSHTFSPDQCVEAYATANRDRASTMGLVFKWS